VRIWRSLDDVPADLGRCVVTIGNFDGVHLGHQHVVARAREVAADHGVEHVVAVTFDPHPIAVLRPEDTPPTLTPIATRIELLGHAGVDDVLVLRFTPEVAAWSPERFIDGIVVSALHATAVVVGENFRFGSHASGDLTTLRDAGGSRDFATVGVDLGGGSRVWSSSHVRDCLAEGDVAGAADALGRPFVIRGVVAEGDRRGRQLGFPTANVPTGKAQAAPADGVYAGWLRGVDGSALGGEALPAAISVGTNPTFAGDRERRVESYVLDRDDLELYGVEVEVAFVARLRGMVTFNSVEELVETMHDDVARARVVLNVPEPV